METDGGGEAERRRRRRRRSELGRLLEAIGSSEVLEKRIPLIKQLEEFSADDLGLILQCLLASWIDSTCSGVSHCKLHRSILQVALKCSDLDITDYLGQFLTLGAKACSWCEKHLHWSVKSIHKEEEHNRLRLEVNSLSFSISTKLLDIAAKCITGLEVPEEECVLNKADDAFPTLEVMVAEPAPAHLAVVMRRPPPKEAPRRMLRGPDGPGTLCNACGQRFLKGRLLHSNSKKRRSSSKENSAAGDDVAALVDSLPSGVGASFDAFFDHTFPSASWEEAGPGQAEGEEELEWLSNKDAFPSVETIAPVEVEEALAIDAPRARTKGRPRRVAANAVLPRRLCTHCGTEETPQWREGPEGPRTLCNACGMAFKKNGRLLPEYRPANSPAFSPQLHSNKHRRVLEMHRQSGPTSSSSPPRYGPLSRVLIQTEEETSAAARATVEACSGEARHVSMGVHLLPVPERPPADNPGFSLLLRSRPNRQSEEPRRRPLLPSAPLPRPDAPSASPPWITDLPFCRWMAMQTIGNYDWRSDSFL